MSINRRGHRTNKDSKFTPTLVFTLPLPLPSIASVKRCVGGVLMKQGTVSETQAAIAASKQASLAIRDMPGPKRGEVIRQIREALDSKVGELGDLVSLEMGKIKSEGKGEVQEVSLSRKCISWVSELIPYSSLSIL